MMNNIGVAIPMFPFAQALKSPPKKNLSNPGPIR